MAFNHGSMFGIFGEVVGSAGWVVDAIFLMCGCWVFDVGSDGGGKGNIPADFDLYI